MKGVVSIGPALEVFLQAVGLVMLGLLVVGLLTRPFWPRVARYFQRWIERDRLIETQQQAEGERRKKAEQELRIYCGDEIETGTNETPVIQTVGRQRDGKQDNDAS